MGKFFWCLIMSRVLFCTGNICVSIFGHHPFTSSSNWISISIFSVVAIPQPSQHKRMHAYVSSVSWLLCQVIYLLSLMSVTRFLFLLLLWWYISSLNTSPPSNHQHRYVYWWNFSLFSVTTWMKRCCVFAWWWNKNDWRKKIFV